MPGDGSTAGVGTTDAPPRRLRSARARPATAPESQQSRGDKRRSQVESLVERTLAPAMGLCVRVFDPVGEDPEGREKARLLVTDCVARCATTGTTGDDEGTRRVVARVALNALDELVGHPGDARPPSGVDLDEILGGPDATKVVAPSGRLRYAVIQDVTAPARRSDRQVAFVVLAAAVEPIEAAVLLGMTPEAVDAALARIGRRLAESEGVDSLETAP